MWLWVWAACQEDKEPACQDCDADVLDADGDGYDARAEGGDDCDDSDALVHPDAEELPYDGIDQDCSGADLLDGDGDGHDSAQHGGDDCDDDDADRYPDAVDTVGDGVDQNCDGLDGQDLDEDGYASIVSGGDDCDDDDGARNPAAAEIWYDGIDQNCDDLCDFDQDGDGGVPDVSQVSNDSPCDLDPGSAVQVSPDCDDTDPLFSWVELLWAHPSTSENSAPLAGAIYVFGVGSDPSAAVTLRGTSGLVPGSSAWSVGGLLVFTPEAALEPDMDYELEVIHGCGTFVTGFHTEPAGVAVELDDLSGVTWELALIGGVWTQPVGVGELLASQLGELSLVVDVQSAGTDSLEVQLAASAEGAQLLCEPTSEVPDVNLQSNPSFGFAPDGLPGLFSSWGPLQFPQVTGHIEVADGASTLRDVSVFGVLDTVPMAAAFGLSGPSAVCDLVASFGVSCISCPDGSGLYCLPVEIEQLEGLESALETLPRTEAEIASDPECL